ncbi:hypothetical protein BKA69DRAFT_1053563 [Paraphysoderma sedebokerense]|nr:hypothetical protein BKA69DRAFT_1053563 [Paraphysoderma sedebokerense]
MPTFSGLPQWPQLLELQRSTAKKIENIFAEFHQIPQKIPLDETSLEEVVQWTKENIDLNSQIKGLLQTFDNSFDDMKNEIGVYLDEERQTVMKLFSECDGNPEQLSATLNGYPTIDDVKKLKRRVIFDMKTFATQFQDYSALFTAYVRSMFNLWNENWIDMSRHQDDLSIQLQENNRSYQMERKYIDTELKHLMQSIKSAEDEFKLSLMLENVRDSCFAIEKAHRTHYSQNMTILKAQLEMTKTKCQSYKSKLEQFCNINGSITEDVSSGMRQQILKTKKRIYFYNESPQNEQETLRQPLLEQKRVEFEDSKSTIKDKAKERRRAKRVNEYELIGMSINEDDAIVASDMINQEHFALKSQLDQLLSVTAEASVQIPQFFAGMRMQLQSRVLDIMDDIIDKWTEDYQTVTERMIQKCTNKLNQDLFDHELRMKRIEKEMYQKKFSKGFTLFTF